MSASFAPIVGVGNRTRSIANWRAQVVSLQVFANSFKREKVKRFVPLNWSANGSTKLFTVKIRQWFSVRGVRSQCFHSLEVKNTSMYTVRAGFCNDVDDAACGATKLCVSSGRHDLEFLHCFEGNIDRCSLTTKLLAKEAVVVVTTIEADVVEDTALSAKVISSPSGPWTTLTPGVRVNKSSNLRPRIGVVAHREFI